MFANFAIFAAVSFASLAGADTVDGAGMCPAAVEALQAIEHAPAGEIAAAVNAVMEADMRCTYEADGMPGHHLVTDLDSALRMCAAEDVADTRGCVEWALSEY